MTEQVIYARDARYKPLFQYYSMPTSCVGGGDTLPAARASYRAALADVLAVDDADLPPIVEHVEVPVIDDVWVRTVLEESRGKQRDQGYRLLQSVLPRLDDVTRKELHEVVTATGAPVMVLVLPPDPMALVLDQMSPYDALWMAFPTGQGMSWTALYKPLADGIQASDEEVLDADQVRHLSVQEFVERFVLPTAGGFSVEISPQGARRTPRPDPTRQHHLVLR